MSESKTPRTDAMRRAYYMLGPDDPLPQDVPTNVCPWKLCRQLETKLIELANLTGETI
jgi:hypothetical protein